MSEFKAAIARKGKVKETTAGFLQRYAQHRENKLQIEERVLRDGPSFKSPLCRSLLFTSFSIQFALSLSRLASPSRAQLKGHDCRLAWSLISPFYTALTLWLANSKTGENALSVLSAVSFKSLKDRQGQPFQSRFSVVCLQRQNIPVAMCPSKNRPVISMLEVFSSRSV